MADIRTYNLGEQEVYASELELVVDESSFTEAKKIKMGVIAPLVDTLSVAANVNVDQYVARVNNGAGAEYKITLTDLFRLIIETIPVTLLYSAGGDYTINIQAYRIGKSVTLMYDHQRTGSGDIVPLYIDNSGEIESLYYLPNTMRPRNDVLGNNHASNLASIIIYASGAVSSVMGNAISSNLYVCTSYLTD